MPAAIPTTRTINYLTRKILLRVLLYYGTRKALPKGIVTVPINGATLPTLGVKKISTEMVTMRDFRLPEFEKNKIIEEQKALVFDTPF